VRERERQIVECGQIQREEAATLEVPQSRNISYLDDGHFATELNVDEVRLPSITLPVRVSVTVADLR
jgi:hypothetical protein